MAGLLISRCLQQLQDIAVEKLRSTAIEVAEEQVKLIKDVEKELEKLRSNLTAIQAVLSDAKKRQINDVSAINWLDKLKAVSQEIVAVLDEGITALNRPRSVGEDEQEEEEEDDERGESSIARPAKKVRRSHTSNISSRFWSTFPVNEVGLRRRIACKVKELNERLDAIATEKRRYSFNTTSVVEKPARRKTTSFVDVSKICGRDEEKEVLMRNLLSDDAFEIISIVGTQGIGKTTLAQLVYNDSEVKDRFDKRIWLCATDPFDETRIAKAIMEALEGRGVDLVELESLHQQIYASIEGKRFFLVVDDMCTEGAANWENLKKVLKNGAQGSRILVTTRDEDVAIMMEAEANKISLEALPWEASGRAPIPGRPS